MRLLILTIFSFWGLWSCSSTRAPDDLNKPPVSFEKSATDKGSYIAALAYSLVGTPYVYGGDSPQQGFDCSGLVFYTHGLAGDKVARTSYSQLASSQSVGLQELTPGDLLFYRINGKPSHVAIYIGDRRFIHAPSSGKKVSIGSMDNPYFKARLIRAGRLYTETQ